MKTRTKIVAIVVMEMAVMMVVQKEKRAIVQMVEMIRKNRTRISKIEMKMTSDKDEVKQTPVTGYLHSLRNNMVDKELREFQIE